MTSLWHYAFVQHALLAGIITAVLAGCIGPIVTARNMAFAVHGLAEVGFTGAAGAVLLGASPMIGVLTATFAAAAAIGGLGVRLRERDVAIGSVLAFGTGLGVLFLALTTRYATEAFSILFGSILAVSEEDVIRSTVVGIIALLALAAIYRPLRFASVDPEVAEARGVPIRLLSTVFLLLLALAVSEAVQIVGVLLILTLLIVPPAAAQRLTAHPGWALVCSVGIALVATLGGLTCALYTSLPVSFFVSAVSFTAYLLARALGPHLMNSAPAAGHPGHPIGSIPDKLER
ncbi:MAG TPA: metal ABC transporter permease [bacterium]|nr:metal ABC transporter permease [bacterium]